MLANKYGKFDSSGRIFSITDHRTPTPWTNVVSNGRYGFVVSQNGGGFSWLDNSQLNVLTRWEMDLVRDSLGRFVYVSDIESGEVWSLSPAPCWGETESFRCDHTPGSTTFSVLRNGVRSLWTLAVAEGDPVEVWSVRLVNEGAVRRRLRISSYFEWCCGVAPDAKREFHKLFISSKHDADRRAILVTKNMWDVPARSEQEHWNRPWPHVAAHAVSGVSFERDLAIGDKELFLGRYGQPSDPAAMRGEAIAGGGFGRFSDAVAALGGDFTLEPGAEVRLFFLLAVGSNEEEALALIDRYRKDEIAGEVGDGSERMWSNLLAPTGVETEAADFDLLQNTWLPYQAISGRLWSRTGYYQQSGAYGFRDQLQDSQVWLPIAPERCRAQLLHHAAHQFADGSVYHWWHPLVETGLRTACSDDYLWLPFVTASYLRETGDWEALRESAPFVDDAKGASLLEHCLRSFGRSFARLSGRGLPLIGSCDWNDGLSAAGVKEKGESVWLAFFLISALGDWMTVLDRIGDRARGEEFAARRARLVEVVNRLAWDGGWFRRATLDNGEWIGSSANTEGQVYLNAQTWAILAEASEESRLASAWRTVKERLLSEMGPLLLAPAYSEPRDEVGYITRYSPGSRENGGVYMHAAAWALMAACKRRDAEAIGAIWRSISPPLRGRDAEGYRAEPYVTPGNVDGPLSETPGKAGWTWYTGSAAWLNRVSLEWVLGIRPTWEGLLIDPAPYAELGLVVAQRRWRGRTICVRFDAGEFGELAHAGGGAPPAARVTLGGRELRGGVLRESDIAADGTAEVEVTWCRAPALTHTRPTVVAGVAVKENLG